MKNKYYYLMNIFFMVITIYWILTMREKITYNYDEISYFLLIGGGLTIILLYLLKMFRVYLILLEENIDLMEFIKVYVKTSFVNLVLPYKLGEIFRIYSYGKMLNNYKNGATAVMIDRYFDTMALFLLLIPLELIIFNSLSPVAFLIIFFLILLTVLYYTFTETYLYLNNYFIKNVVSCRSIKVLDVLETGRALYFGALSMIRGRGAFLFIISCISWLLEYFIINTVALILNFEASSKEFVLYLNSLFQSSGYNEIVYFYVLVSIVIFSSILILSYGYMKCFGGKGDIVNGK